MGIGQIISFLYAPSAAEAIGFRYTYDLVVGVSILFGVIYLAFGTGCQGCRGC